MTGLTVSLSAKQVEQIRRHTRQHKTAKPGAVVTNFVRLALQSILERYYSDYPDIGDMTPAQRNAEQIKLNLEYLRERGI
jgi:hypothetical protein